MVVWSWRSGLQQATSPVLLSSYSCWEVLGLAVVVWAPQAMSGRGTRAVRSACGVLAGAGASCSSCIFESAFHGNVGLRWRFGTGWNRHQLLYVLQ